MDDNRRSYDKAEKAFLDAEGLDPTSKMIHLDRLDSDVRVLDVGAGPPVLFVPGTMTGAAGFARLVSRMPSYRCIMIDRPGVGLSPQLPKPPITLQDHHQTADHLLADVLDGLDIDQSHIVSTSLGGWSAFRSMAAHPDRFLRSVGIAFCEPCSNLPL